MPLPLLKLAREEQPDPLEIILSFMDILDLISLSLISRATKALVVEIGISIKKFSLNLHECFKIRLTTQESDLVFDLSPKHENWNGGDHPVALTMADPVVVNYSRSSMPVEWKNIEEFEIRDWIRHLKDITHTRIINEITLNRKFEKFEVESVITTLEGWDINLLIMLPTCTREYCQLIYQRLHTRSLKFFHNPFRNSEDLHKVLIQNYDRIDITELSGINITLDDLLMMNCRQLSLYPPDGALVKDLNRFFKHWRFGSNRRLKSFTIAFPWGIHLDIDEIVRGIRHVREGSSSVVRGANGSRARLVVAALLFNAFFID